MATTKKKAVTSTATPTASPTLAATPPPPTAPPLISASPPPVTGVANGSNTGTKVEIQTSYLALIAGLLAYYQPDDEFMLAQGIFTRDQLIAAFQQFIASAEATKASNQAWRADVQTERASEQTVAPVRANLRLLLSGRFGKSSTQLAKFGFAPAKVGVKSTVVKTAAVVKGTATRAARGTKGSVQKKSIKGNVTGVVITPVTTGTAAPQVVAPAAAGNAASTSNGAGAPAASASPVAPGTPSHS
jgi:hypothetical protein